MADTKTTAAAATAVTSTTNNNKTITTAKSKRSKIVSEESDDLEESLMQEFNIRLKTCMDHPPLDANQEEVSHSESTSSSSIISILPTNATLSDDTNVQYLYENVEIIKTIGKTEFNLTDLSIETENNSNSQSSIIDFIQFEHKDLLMEAYLKTDEKQVKNNENLCSKSEEQQSVASKPALELPIPITNFTEATDDDLVVSSPDMDNQDGMSSGKDRMLLLTDDASYLLLTQTITSPMLILNKEKIDFLKGLQRDSLQNTLSDISHRSEPNDEPFTEEVIYETTPPFLDVVPDCEEVKRDHQTDKVVVKEDENMDIESTIRSNDVELQRNCGLFDHDTDTSTSILQFQPLRNNNEEVIIVAQEQPTDILPEWKYADDYPIMPSVKSLKNPYIKSANTENMKKTDKEKSETTKLKSLDTMKQIIKFEQNPTPTASGGGAEVTPAASVLYKSSFNKFVALQKKNVLDVRSTNSSKSNEKFNRIVTTADVNSCKSCKKVVFQMEQMKAEKCIWHKNCFRCQECNKQLAVDTYGSNEGTLYCKPHFKALFTPKAVEDSTLPSDKSDHVKEGFQVFEHHQQVDEENQLERYHSSGTLNVKRAASILNKLARFQVKGMDVVVVDDGLNGIPIEKSYSSAYEAEEEAHENDEYVELIRTKRAQNENPFHFIGMSELKSKWESISAMDKLTDERREARKQGTQSIQSHLLMGKQGKMKEAYQQAVLDSDSGVNVKRLASATMAAEMADANAKSIKERFEKGSIYGDGEDYGKGGMEIEEDMQLFESGISKKSSSIFLELNANASKAAPLSPISPQRSAINNNVTKARCALIERIISENVVKSTMAPVDYANVETATIEQKFKFFETYREPEKQRKQFRITPQRDGQQENVLVEIYRDPNVVRTEESPVEDAVAKQTHNTTKMLKKENGIKDQISLGPRRDSGSSEYSSPVGSDDRHNGNADNNSGNDRCYGAMTDIDLIKVQITSRVKKLRAKFGPR